MEAGDCPPLNINAMQVISVKSYLKNLSHSVLVCAYARADAEEGENFSCEENGNYQAVQCSRSDEQDRYEKEITECGLHI